MGRQGDLDRLYITTACTGLSDAGPFAVTIDVIDFFSSVDIGAVYALNLLPDELVRSVIDTRQLRFRRNEQL